VSIILVHAKTYAKIIDKHRGTFSITL